MGFEVLGEVKARKSHDGYYTLNPKPRALQKPKFIIRQKLRMC